MNLLSWWRERQRARRCPPHVEIGYFGTRTEKPQVCVSVTSWCGSQTIDTWPANITGDAHATLCARGLAHIMQVPVTDRRGCAEFHSDPDVPDHCEMCMRRFGEHLYERN